MIPFFRKIRKKMADDNRPVKYMRYAIGEIVLVVIGILIALQINNWNEERIQKQELDGLLQSIAGGVQSDIRDLNLLATARANMGKKGDSIFSHYILGDVKTISLEETAYISSAFQNVLNFIYFKSNLSAFESLKNSTYFGKLQGTDLALLLSAYYTTADKIKIIEENYNESLEVYRVAWYSKFRDNGQDIFIRPWVYYDDLSLFTTRYFEVLRDMSTKNIFGNAYNEPSIIQTYEEQILMGTKLIEMIKSSNTTFDQQTKLDFSGILYSFADADLISILINGEIPTGFEPKYAASDDYRDHFSFKEDYFIIEYPENRYDWGSPYFEVNALGGRVNEMDFSNYTKIFIEMKGEIGGEQFEITMKDKNDPPDGSESRVQIELTDQWKIYEIQTNQFKTADMQFIMVPLGFVFQGPLGRRIHIRSIQFKKD